VLNNARADARAVAVALKAADLEHIFRPKKPSNTLAAFLQWLMHNKTQIHGGGRQVTPHSNLFHITVYQSTRQF